MSRGELYVMYGSPLVLLLFLRERQACKIIFDGVASGFPQSHVLYLALLSIWPVAINERILTDKALLSVTVEPLL